MENINFLENLATRLGQNASVKNVYGDPIVTEGKTIIPVAEVAFGFGGGYGEKKKKSLLPGSPESDSREDKKGIAGEGAGGGGGMYARPKGIYEITSHETRFIPANYNKHLLIAFTFGFLIRKWLFRKQKS